MAATLAASSPRRSPLQRQLSVLQDFALVLVTLLFVSVHINNLLDGNWHSVPFALQQVILLVLFITRRRARVTTTRAQDWLFATIGAWGPLALNLHDGGAATIVAIGFGMQVIGLSGVMAGNLGLGRSFGVVAANRGLKTGGAYRVVRHPIYACHLVTEIGFILANPAAINVAIVAVVTAAQCMRIRAEERILRATSDYDEYAATVRWRLIPGVF